MPYRTKAGGALELLYLEELSAEVDLDVALCLFRLVRNSPLTAVCPTGGVCEGPPDQHFEGLGHASCRLVPHVPEPLADCEDRLHTG